MSSEIFYSRAYIQVEDRFIPIVCQGSSNCFEFNIYGREVPEKVWTVLNHFARSQLLFSKAEIAELAKQYEAISIDSGGGIRKSRNRPFAPGEFERWILTGMKTAYTVEEYTAYGNRVIVLDCAKELYEKYPIRTTEQLLKKLDEFAGRTNIRVAFADTRSIMRPKRIKTTNGGNKS